MPSSSISCRLRVEISASGAGAGLAGAGVAKVVTIISSVGSIEHGDEFQLQAEQGLRDVDADTARL